MLTLRRILKDLFQEKTRMILTILAVAWGTFTITSMLSVGEGLRLTFAKAVADSGHNVLEVQGGFTSKTENGLMANRRISLMQKDYRDIQSYVQNIVRMSPQYDWNVITRYGKMEDTIRFKAVSPDFAAINQISIQKGGRFISPLDVETKKPVVVLGTETLKQFFGENENPVGKTLWVGHKKFLVIGVMQKKSEIAASHAPDAFLNWIPYSTYVLYQNPQTIKRISMTYQDEARLKTMEKEIQRVIARNHGVSADDEGIVSFTEMANRQAKINTFFIGLQVFLGIIGALTLLVAGVGIANVMFASVSRSMHEIGLKMAIGARTYQILSQYIIESLLATLIGGLIGIVLSGLLVVGINVIPMSGKLIDAIGKPTPVLSWFVIFLVIFVLGIMGVLAGFFPALKASRIDPTEALRYE